MFHTNISHFVKFAHVVKLYVAYMRNLHIDKIHPKSAAFCIRFQFFTFMSGFYNVIQTGYRYFICFTKKIWDKSKTANKLYKPRGAYGHIEFRHPVILKKQQQHINIVLKKSSNVIISNACLEQFLPKSLNHQIVWLRRKYFTLLFMKSLKFIISSLCANSNLFEMACR